MTTQQEPTEAELGQMSPAQLQAYADTFAGEPELLQPPAPRRLDSSISIRFSAEELDGLRHRADAAGMRVTAFIRALALQHQDTHVLDLVVLRQRLASLARDVHDLEQQLS